MTDDSQKIILDLCGGTGAWSDPYAKAGYDRWNITLPRHNVLEFEPPKNVYGILAAPPCTHFSFARTTAKTPRDFSKAMVLVEACLKIIWKCRLDGNLKFWAMENPKGYLRQFLGKPYLEMQPFEYGDPYQKNTDIWGYFNRPKKNIVSIPPEEKLKFATNSQKLKVVKTYTPLFHNNDYLPDPEMDFRAIRRAVTPSGFANQFFKANR